ncbi:hypothetical protein VHEMI10215 [[Torrubiella] hemipterigena]|uniref:Beta-galactosidase n=1 Tax=[Torrubiella] hemipterigena TaxID=1531966 RepID=A0A0A1TRU1_9HYPO|nr:hypothetical protein VHEMI10215 [[Torrubiella] hemipterigena]
MRLLPTAIAASSLLAGIVTATLPNKGTFTYDEHSFLLNGKPYQILGGQMDPQRIPPEYWRQRLQMAKAMGLNTILSYIFWDSIEPVRGQFNFKGRNDLAHFFDLANKEGLKVVIRPGPYICGEHEWGGLPWWLSNIDNMAIRQDNAAFYNASKAYIDRLGHELRRFQISHGGPIIMTQLENEYGSFGSDKKYLQAQAGLLRNNFDTPIYTTDGGGVDYLKGGTLSGVLAAVDGFDPIPAFEARQEYLKTDPTVGGPLMHGEFYTSWLDLWDSDYPHSTPTYAWSGIPAMVDSLDKVVKGNNSFGLYMFHGGTNFGFEGGSTNSGKQGSVTSSYDYGAPLDESGRVTELYSAIRKMLVANLPAGSVPEVPATPPMLAVPKFELKPVSSLFDVRVDKPTLHADQPVTMEALDQATGFILYQHTATEDATGAVHAGDHARDRIIILVNGVRAGIQDTAQVPLKTVNVTLKQGDVLQLLVENIGRVDHTHEMKEQRKGIVGAIKVGDKALTGWDMFSLPLKDISAESIADDNGPPNIKEQNGPVFYTGSFDVPKGVKIGMAADTYLSFPAGVKGQLWVNGINLGKLWHIGPQQSLFVPGAWLKTGKNEVVLLELEPTADTKLVGEGITTRQWFNQPSQDN